MKYFLASFLLISGLCFGQFTTTGGATTTGGWSEPVSNPISLISISPTTVTLNDGSGVTYTATGTFAIGNTSDVSLTSLWTSSNLAIATNVGTANAQTFKCVGVGSVTVTASNAGNSGIAAQNCFSFPATSADNTNCNPDGTRNGPTTDGPAALPTKCYYTAVSATPSPGTVHPAISPSQLGAEYAAAACGDTILVNSGSFTGTVTLPGKGCDDLHYITIEGTGVADPNFPTEGSRATPLISRVASLPNRPAFVGAATATAAPQFLAPASSNAFVLNGTDHIRFLDLEITRVSTGGVPVFNLVDMTATGATQTNHIIFDRVWFHGVNADGAFPKLVAADTSTTRAIYLGQSHHVAVIDSYMSDFYDTGSGSGFGSANGNSDAQCIGGGTGTVANSGWGIYKFVNNHCEGSGESILIGGGAGPSLTPVGCTFGSTCNDDVPDNIEVRRNEFFKPNSWNGNTTTINAAGWPIVKNGIEFKSGRHILLEGNVFQNCWYSSQPYCYAFDFAPKNQMNNSTDPGTCPSCLVEDAVGRYNYSYNYPGHQIALYTTSFVGGCVGCGQTLGRRFSINNNVVGDNLNKGSLTQSGFGCVEFLATAGPISNVSMRHNTCVGASGVMMVEGAQNTNSLGQLDQIVFQDNLMAEGQFGVQASSNANSGCDGGGTGHPNYDSSNNWLGILNACINGTTNTWTADHNGTWGSSSIANWPAGNTLLANFAAVGFTTVPGNNSNGFPDSGFNPSIYALGAGSGFHNAASDGTDIGADIGTLTTKIAGVSGNAPGNLIIYPASSTVELGATVPFSCDDNGNTTCTFTLLSGSGSITASGNYTALNVAGAATIQASNGVHSKTASITIAGVIPTATGDCATTPYPHSGMTENVCQMTHTETVGGAVARKWKVVVPTNYVSGQSGLILHIGDSHFLNGFNVDPCSFPSNEIEGWASYLNTVPTPAPVLVCSEGYSSSSGTFSVYNSLGRLNYNWLNGVVPNDVDFLRQLILLTVRDLNLNPKSVFVENYFNANGNGGMAFELATTSSDLVAAVGTGMESNFQAMNSSFTVNRTGAANFGQTLAAPAVPISAITLTGLTVAQVGVFSQLCGNNLAPSAQQYQPLTVDDTFRFLNQTDLTTASAFSPSNVGSSFCNGVYDGAGNGQASSLEVRKDTGGKLGTAIYAYKLVGNASKATPFCGYDYNGANTLGCGVHNSTAVLDFRNSTCTFAAPCNHFLDAGTGPASASGYSGMDIEWKFFKSHLKP